MGWKITQMTKTDAEAFDSSTRQKLCKAIKGGWESETVDGVTVAKSSRITRWSAFCSGGTLLQIPENGHDYMAFVAVNPDKSLSNNDAGYLCETKAVFIPKGTTSLSTTGFGNYIYIEGSFVNFESSEGE